MNWWNWLVLLIALVLLTVTAGLVVQARRRSGTVIAVRHGRRPGRGGTR